MAGAVQQQSSNVGAQPLPNQGRVSDRVRIKIQINVLLIPCPILIFKGNISRPSSGV